MGVEDANPPTLPVEQKVEILRRLGRSIDARIGVMSSSGPGEAPARTS